MRIKLLFLLIIIIFFSSQCTNQDWNDFLFTTPGGDKSGTHDRFGYISDNYEPDNDYSSAKFLSDLEIQEHTFHTWNDVDWISLYFSEDNERIVEISYPESCSPDMILYDSSLGELTSGTYIDYYFNGNTTYYIKVYNKNGCSGYYEIHCHRVY